MKKEEVHVEKKELPDTEGAIAIESREQKKENLFDVYNLSVGAILGMLVLTIAREVGIDSHSISTVAILSILFIFGISYLWGSIRKRVKNSLALILIFITSFLLLSLLHTLVERASSNKKFNPDNYSYIIENDNMELLTGEQLLDKVNGMTDDELKDYLISEVYEISSTDLKIAMLKKIDNLVLPQRQKNELKNEFESMTGDDLRSIMIDDINNLSAEDVRQAVMEKARSYKP
jgi:hypothetical protein